MHELKEYDSKLTDTELLELRHRRDQLFDHWRRLKDITGEMIEQIIGMNKVLDAHEARLQRLDRRMS